MALEVTLAYLLVIPVLCLCAAYVAPWSITDLPECVPHGQAFEWALHRMFVEKWHITALGTLFWLPLIVILLILGIIGAVFIGVFCREVLDDMIGD